MYISFIKGSFNSKCAIHSHIGWWDYGYPKTGINHALYICKLSNNGNWLLAEEDPLWLPQLAAIVTSWYKPIQRKYTVDYMHVTNLITFKVLFEASRYDLTKSLYNLKKIKLNPLPEVKFHDSLFWPSIIRMNWTLKMLFER